MPSPAPNNFGLVIFDCDGVLVDSERLAVRTEAKILEHPGWPLSESEIVERFVGRSAQYMHGEIERELRRSIDWEVEFESRYRQVFECELLPVEGVVEALDQIAIPTCVASSGSHAKIRFSLELTGLTERFAERIFSVEDVEHGKPAPDIFLHAARQMDVSPRHCAVIEDSVSGVTAGLAAGMRVFAFAGGGHPSIGALVGRSRRLRRHACAARSGGCGLIRGGLEVGGPVPVRRVPVG